MIMKMFTAYLTQQRAYKSHKQTETEKEIDTFHFKDTKSYKLMNDVALLYQSDIYSNFKFFKVRKE